MKILNTAVEIILIAILTVALYLDFFPEPYLPDWFSLIFWSALILLIISIFLNKKLKITEKETNIFTSLLGLYIFILIIAFSLAGGNSSSGISLSNPIIWIIFIVGLFTDWKKLRNHKMNYNN